MAEPDSTSTPNGEPGDPQAEEQAGGSIRDSAEKLLLAGLGLVSSAADQAREAVGTPPDAPPLRERAQEALAGLLDDLGFVTRERYEELELKVAQLEHRVKLLEGASTTAAPAPPTHVADADLPPASA